jgi:hypothetical protein
MSGRLGATLAKGWRGRPTSVAHQSWPWHRGSVANLFCSPWDDDGQQWRPVLARRFGPSSTSMLAVSGAPPTKMKAPTWTSVFSEAPGAVDLAPGSG